MTPRRRIIRKVSESPSTNYLIHHQKLSNVSYNKSYASAKISTKLFIKNNDPLSEYEVSQLHFKLSLLCFSRTFTNSSDVTILFQTFFPNRLAVKKKGVRHVSDVNQVQRMHVAAHTKRNVLRELVSLRVVHALMDSRIQINGHVIMDHKADIIWTRMVRHRQLEH